VLRSASSTYDIVTTESSNVMYRVLTHYSVHWLASLFDLDFCWNFCWA